MRMKSKCPYKILFLLSIGFLVCAILQYIYIAKEENVIHARFLERQIKAAMLDDYYENYRANKNTNAGKNKQPENIPDVTLWNMKEQVLVSVKDLELMERFVILEGYGDLERILPGQRTKGVYPPKGDTEGCAVSDVGAKALFGSSDVLGKKVNVENREYVIRGIVKAKKPMLWLQNPEAEGFAYVEMRYQERPSAQMAKDWLNQQGFGVPEVMLAGCDYSAFLFLFLTLPVWVFGIYFYIELKRKIHLSDNGYLHIVLYIIWMVGLVVLLFAGVQYSFRFSLDYIPKKWSDFGFYGAKAAQLMESARSIAEIKVLPGDARLLRHSRNGAYFAWASLLCMGGAVMFRRNFCKNK